jgi:hypothetical protein
MQKFISSGWTRLIVAFAAFFLCAGSGVVFAGGPGPTYPAPEFASIVGSGSLAKGASASYTLFVTFVDSTTANIFYPNCTFSVGIYTTTTGGTFSGGTYHAPATGATGRVVIQGSFTSNNATVTATRAISIT